MKKIDVILSAICGLAVSWLAIDFFGSKAWIAFIIFPILSIFCLWILYLLRQKALFIYQAGKFVLAGAFADVVDIKAFQLIFLFLPFSLPVKAISFIIGTFVKYFSDKHWSFEKPEPKGMHKEMIKFFIIALGGMAINVASFYFYGKLNPGILPVKLWQEFSIILAAITAGLWNFIGYKFFVFKK
jgi:putative flippase GtrA